MAAVLGLIIGVVIGVFVRPDIPIALQPYLRLWCWRRSMRCSVPPEPISSAAFPISLCDLLLFERHHRNIAGFPSNQLGVGSQLQTASLSCSAFESSPMCRPSDVSSSKDDVI